LRVQRPGQNARTAADYRDLRVWQTLVTIAKRLGYLAEPELTQFGELCDFVGRMLVRLPRSLGG
jgi:hypothetical protein